MSTLSDSVSNLRYLGRTGQADIAAVVVERLVDCCRRVIQRDRGVDRHMELIYMLSDLLQLKSEFVLFGHAVAAEKSLQESLEQLDGGENYARPILDVLQEVNAGRSSLRRPNVRMARPSSPEPPEEEVLPDALLEALTRIVERVAARKPVEQETRRRSYLSLQQVMREIRELLVRRRRMLFEDVFETSTSRERVVLSFLAVLILTKMGTVRISQQGRFGDIMVEYVEKGHD